MEAASAQAYKDGEEDYEEEYDDEDDDDNDAEKRGLPDIWEGVRPTLPVNSSPWKYTTTDHPPPPELEGKAGGKYLLLDDGLVYVEASLMNSLHLKSSLTLWQRRIGQTAVLLHTFLPTKIAMLR